jgi:tetratricopeptide (TPR) repeat protein
MLGFIFKKSSKKIDEDKNSVAEKLASKLKASSEKLSEFLGKKFALAEEEFFAIKEKCENLQETNYKLGLKHLEKGNLSEAIFRFRIIKKIWPNSFDAYYYLAYSLALKGKLEPAKIILTELLTKNPDFDTKAQDLLNHINQATSNAA